MPTRSKDVPAGEEADEGDDKFQGGGPGDGIKESGSRISFSHRIATCDSAFLEYSGQFMAMWDKQIGGDCNFGTVTFVGKLQLPRDNARLVPFRMQLCGAKLVSAPPPGLRRDPQSHALSCGTR